MIKNNEFSEDTPLLSVIIPVYNVEEYLRQALDSVRNQSYKHVEFIVIDDGSTDSSGKILREYQAKDDRFRVFEQENCGLSATRNRGLSEARGDIVYFFDSDDLVVEGTFEKVIDRMINTDSQIVLFGVVPVDNGGNILDRFASKKGWEIETTVPGKEFIKEAIPSNGYGAVVQKYFIRKSFLIENGLKFEENYIHEDESFTLEAFCLADRITAFSEPMIKKRLRQNSIMSTQKGIKNVEGWARAIERVLEFIKRNNVDLKTREIVLIRLRQLAHTAIRTFKNLDNPEKPLEHYLPKEIQRELGFLVSTHARSTFLYRVLKLIDRKIG